MARWFAPLLGLSLVAPAPGVDAADGRELRDLYFGEALYYAYQGEYFDAIERLDAELGQYYALDEPALDTLHPHIDDAEFSVGDFELRYRMHHRAGRAIEAVIEANIDEAVRNEAVYRLARIHFQKNQPLNAQHALERIRGEVPESIRDDLAFLRAQVYMANGRFSEAAAILEQLQNAEGYEGFAAYNLGVALMRAGDQEQGIRALDRAGQTRGREAATLALRDKANLVLGSKLLEDERPQLAEQYLNRVRLEGPFSNRALLGAGWAAAELQRYDRALVPWTILAERDVTDQAVQEALLAVPYAYGKLGVYGKAALGYGKALEAFGEEIDQLDASIRSIREGRFLEALVREELKQDPNWMVNLRQLPDTPETYYLTELMASHDFQESLKNYLDLDALRKRLDEWEKNLDAYEDIIALRRQYYEPLLPDVDSRFRELDSRMRLRVEQRDRIEERLHAMLTAPRPEFLATAEERVAANAIAAVEKRTADARVSEQILQRIRRLKGVLHWRMQTEYDERLTDAHRHLRQLDGAMTALHEQYNAFVRTRQAATHSYEGYAAPIRRYRTRLLGARERVANLMARQGHLLEQMAIEELEHRRTRLEQHQVKARFAMADSYDRATKAQAEDEVEKGTPDAEGAGQAGPEREGEAQ